MDALPIVRKSRGYRGPMPTFPLKSSASLLTWSGCCIKAIAIKEAGIINVCATVKQDVTQGAKNPEKVDPKIEQLDL